MILSALWLIASIPLGFCVGVVTGLFPGIHVNVVASLMVGVASILFGMGVPPLAIALFIAAVAMTHAFFDIVPSLFLGVPAEEAYALLPTQQLVREGRGMEAMRLALYGSWRGMITSATFIGVFVALGAAGFDALGRLEDFLQPFLFWVMLVIAVVLIAKDRNSGWAAVIFLVSGLFGVVIFATPLIPGGTDAAFNGLFPALSGLFGVSGLLLALTKATGKLPPQRHVPELGPGPYGTSAFTGAFGGMLVGLLPGLGAANVATLMALFTNQKDGARYAIAQRQYIVTTSAINVGDTVFGIAALYFLGKTRSGASVAIGHLLRSLDLTSLIAILVVMATVGWMAQRVLITSGLRMAKFINVLSYKGLSLGVIGLITTLVWQTTGLWGVVILIGTSLLGLVAPLVEIRRAQAMGVFLVPVMLYYSGHQAKIVTWLRLEAISLPASEPDLLSLGVALVVSMVVAVLMYVLGALWPETGRFQSASPSQSPR